MKSRLPILAAIFGLFFSGLVASRYVGRIPHRGYRQSSGIFQLPHKRTVSLQGKSVLRRLYREGRYQHALELAKEFLRHDGENPGLWVLRAVLHAAIDESEEAMDALYQAVHCGFDEPQQLLQAPEFFELRSDPRFPLLLREAAASIGDRAERGNFAAAGIVEGQSALVTERNTTWDDRAHVLVTTFAEDPQGRRFFPFRKSQLQAPVIALVNQWISEGTAAGFRGILYDNRDRGHSTLQRTDFPQLAFVEYGPTARASGVDFGAHPELCFNLPTFGNASTAQVGDVFWCSNPRKLMVDQVSRNQVLNNWRRDQLYCFPSHQDFCVPHGDVFPFNLPCWVVSEGSSGSDQPFLRAIALCAASFRPEVREFLETRRLLWQTVQWLMRRSWTFVESPADYLSGRAHAVVFRGHELDEERMVRMAHDLTTDRVPAQIILRVAQEDLPLAAETAELAALPEIVLTGATAIGRIHRTRRLTRRMVVDVGSSGDFNGRTLTFEWRLLQGDAERVQIRTLNNEGSRAELLIDWHDPFPVPWNTDLQTARVDIGVFADNGESLSFPGLISTWFPPTGRRVYSDGKLISVDYLSPAAEGIYADPVLEPVRMWRDIYRYEDGVLMGWDRFGSDGQVDRFDADGRQADPGGEAKIVTYQRITLPSGLASLQYSAVDQQQPSGPLKPGKRDSL